MAKITVKNTEDISVFGEKYIILILIMANSPQLEINPD